MSASVGKFNKVRDNISQSNHAGGVGVVHGTTVVTKTFGEQVSARHWLVDLFANEWLKITQLIIIGWPLFFSCFPNRKLVMSLVDLELPWIWKFLTLAPSLL